MVYQYIEEYLFRLDGFDGEGSGMMCGRRREEVAEGRAAGEALGFEGRGEAGLHLACHCATRRHLISSLLRIS